MPLSFSSVRDLSVKKSSQNVCRFAVTMSYFFLPHYILSLVAMIFKLHACINDNCARGV
jgi:hypothetical protein